MPSIKLEFLGRRDKPAFFITQDATKIGRGSDNDVVLCEAEEDKVVSVHHCVIERSKAGWTVRDLGSSNKLFLNGKEVEQAPLGHEDVLQIGRKGPKVRILLLTDPSMRMKSVFQATQLILRQKLATRKYRIIIGIVGALAILFGVLFSVTQQSKLELLESLQKERLRLEGLISGANTQTDRLALIGRLNRIILEREKVLKSLPANQRPKRSFVEEEVIRLLKRFHETSYAVPQIFIDRVQHFVTHYTKNARGRLDIELGLRNGKALVPSIKKLFESRKLPAELAYIAFVESKFDRAATNRRSGARGMWQLMPKVAREYGLTVDNVVDERTDFLRSTKAARALLLNLISIYGVRSFMLVLAAYNAGDAKIRFQLKKLENPVEQRGFWTLVHLGLLKEETTNYIPKFIAATIVFEHLKRYGFEPSGAG